MTYNMSAIAERAWEAIAGAYDLQVHVAPDVIGRRIDDLDLAREFLASGLRGFVLKSHYIPTAERAKVVTKAVPGIRPSGRSRSIMRWADSNPVAVEIAGRSGARSSGCRRWMPRTKPRAAYRRNKKLPFWAEIQRELAAMGIAPPRMRVIDDAGQRSCRRRGCAWN